MDLMWHERHLICLYKMKDCRVVTTFFFSALYKEVLFRKESLLTMLMNSNKKNAFKLSNQS